MNFSSTADLPVACCDSVYPGDGSGLSFDLSAADERLSAGGALHSAVNRLASDGLAVMTVDLDEAICQRVAEVIEAELWRGG